MADVFHDDILLPQDASRPRRSPAFAFVPIAVALFGVAAILVGGVSARDRATTETRPAIDTITTGSIAAAGDMPAAVRPQHWE
jgi:hypothetical protein